MTAPRARTRGAPGGFALVELLLALTLLGVVLGAVVGVAVAQQRAYAALAARRATRAQLRDGALALARELRPLALRDSLADPGDLRIVADTLIELLATTGASVVCARPAADVVAIPAGVAAGGLALTWWTAEPREGDVLLALDPGADPAAGDDAWRRAPVRGVAASASGCAGSPFAGAGGWRVTLADAAALPPTIGAGTPVRFARARRWTHYRASDGGWQLGLREADGGGWSETQPVAGPLRARGAEPGLSVRAVDPAGVAATIGGAIGIVAVLRATPAVAWAPGRRPVRTESVVVGVVPRGVTRPGAGGVP